MGGKTKIDWCDSTWNKIPNYNDYYASRNGEILSTKRGKKIILRPISSSDGHLYVFLYENGNMKKEWVHRLVLLAWDREAKAGEECRHLNDVQTDNRLENLAWGTRLENVNDKRINGGICYGEKSKSHKLTESQVMEIRKKFAGDKSSFDLSKEYGVSKNTILQIVRGNK